MLREQYEAWYFYTGLFIFFLTFFPKITPMCFYMSKYSLKPILAESDKEVWKVLEGKTLYPERGEVVGISPVKKFPYKSGMTYYEDIDLKERYLSSPYEDTMIKKGFNCFSSKVGAEEYMTYERLMGRMYILVKMIIPKGSRYWYSPPNDTIITERIFCP